MRKYLGTALIVLSVILMLATLLSIWWGIAHPSQHPSEDHREVEALSSAIVLSALGTLEVLLLIAGLCLRYSSKPTVPPNTGCRQARGLVSLSLYLCGSIGLAMLGSLTYLRDISIGPLWLVVCQPLILFQLALGPLGITQAPDAARNALLAAFHVAYFAAVLYPAYRIAALDRSRERARIRLMTIILLLCCSLHALVALFVIVARRA